MRLLRTPEAIAEANAATTASFLDSKDSDSKESKSPLAAANNNCVLLLFRAFFEASGPDYLLRLISHPPPPPGDPETALPLDPQAMPYPDAEEQVCCLAHGLHGVGAHMLFCGLAGTRVGDQDHGSMRVDSQHRFCLPTLSRLFYSV